MPRPALRRGRTVWLEAEPAATRYPVLRRHLDTDIAIVGGGMTGAMIAQAFARTGVGVALVEAARIGHGSTAASTALLLQEPDLDLGDLAGKYGAKIARRVWQLGQEATRDFITTLKQLHIKCDLKDRDSIYYTLSGERADRLARELRQRRAAGLGGAWIDGRQFNRVVGFDGAGIRTRGNAQLNPLRACIGLVKAAAESGAEIFERSEVKSIARTRSGVHIKTGAGTINARQVVIATGYATKYFKPLAGRFKMRRTYVLATRQFGWLERRRIGLGDVLLWDTERPYHYIRWTDDHRLLFGGEDRPLKPGAHRDKQFEIAIDELREYFEQRFPSLRRGDFAMAWEGLFAMTSDSLPYIGPHRRYPGHVFALGYGGNGMTFASLAARILVEQWQGIESRDHELFSFNRAKSLARP